MKNIKLLPIVILSCLIIIACNEKQHKVKESLPYLINFERCISDGKNVKISNIADTIELVELKSPDEYPISMVWNLIPAGNYWYIHASEGIYKFTNKGEYVTKISEEGQGPNEYTSLCGIAIDTVHNEFLINDYTKLIFFDLDGNYLRMKQKKGNVLLYRCDFSDGILWGTEMGLKTDMYMLCGLNRQLDTIYSKLNPFSNIKSKKMGGGSMMAGWKPFYHYKNNLYLNGPGCNDTIFQLRGNLCTPYAIFDMGKYKLPLKYEAWYDYEAHWYNGYHYWNIPAIAEDERYLFILAQRYAPLNGDRANHEDIYRYLMYDKKERIGFRMNEDKDEKIIDDILGGPTIWPYWITDDYYIGLIDAYWYKEKLKKGNFKLSPEMQKVVDSWNHDTNIILMLCHKKKMNQR